MNSNATGRQGLSTREPRGSPSPSRNLFADLLVHEFHRNRKTWTNLGMVLAGIYAVNLLKIDTVILDLSILTPFLPLTAFMLALLPLTRLASEGSLHLVLSIPVPGRAFLVARFLATAIPLSLLAIPSWPIAARRLAKPVSDFPIVFFSHTVVDYLSGLQVVNVGLDFKTFPVWLGGPTLPAGHLLVLSAIILVVFVSSAFGMFLWILGADGGYKSLGSRWSVPFLRIVRAFFGVLLFLLILPFPISAKAANLLPWPPSMSCSRWLFGIQDCTIATLGIALRVVITTALFWLAVRLWDRRLEVQ